MTANKVIKIAQGCEYLMKDK